MERNSEQKSGAGRAERESQAERQPSQGSVDKETEECKQEVEKGPRCSRQITASSKTTCFSEGKSTTLPPVSD